MAVHLIETETEFTGTESGTRTQRWWYSPVHAMPLRWSDRTEGGRSGATYTSDLTVTVVSLPPPVGAHDGASGLGPHLE